MTKMKWDLAFLQENLLIGSTLVEGSTLTQTSAEAILSGRTVAGHAIRDARELLNYGAAAEWLIREVTEVPYLSADMVLHLHRLLFAGIPGESGAWKQQGNFTYRSDGSRFDFLAPEAVPTAMRRWCHDFNTADVKDTDATKVSADAAALYYRFATIHPFDDGNGRLARVLMSYWLHWKAGRLFRFFASDKLAHLEAMEAANDGNLTPLKDFFARRAS